MKKKSKILSLLALGLTVPAVMLTGCTGAETETATVKHQTSYVYQNDDTHHWHKCACGENNCTAKYNQEVHEFVVIDQQESRYETKTTLACDCGEIITNVSDTEEGIYTIAQNLFSQYKNLERTFTATIFGDEDYLLTANIQQEGLCLFSEEIKIKAVKSDDKFKLYTQDNSDKQVKLCDLNETISYLSTWESNIVYLLELCDYLEWNENTEYSIEKSGDTYLVTYTVDGGDVKVQFNKNEVLKMFVTDGVETTIVSFSSTFNKEAFDEFDVSEGFTEVQ